MRQIISGVLIMFLAFGLLSCTNITLAPGSFTTSYGYDQSSLPEIEYKLAEMSEFPEGSIYKPTDDFELITENLPKPTISRKYIEDFELTPKEQGVYSGNGKLEKVWSYDFKNVCEWNDDYNLLDSPVINAWRIIIWDNQILQYCYFDSADGSMIEIQNQYIFDKDSCIELQQENNTLILDKDNKFNTSLKTMGNTIIWSFDYKPEEDRDGIELTGIFGNTLSLCANKGHIICLDVSTGQTKYIIKNKHSSRLYESFECAGFLWMMFDEGSENFVPYKKSFYRINPDTLEIVEVIGDFFPGIIIDEFYEFDDNIYFTRDEMIHEYDIQTGINTNTYPAFSENISSSLIQNPFIGLSQTDTEVNIYYYDIHKDRGWEKIHQYSTKTDCGSNTFAKILLRDFLKSSHSAWLMCDDESIYSFDTQTGEKTWWIDRVDAGEDAVVEIVDQNGVLISNGSVITCYRAPEEN